MNQERIWTKDFIFLFIANFMAVLMFYLLMTSMAQYAILEFDTNNRIAGLIVNMFIIGALIGRMFVGKYSNRLGRKKLMVGGNLLSLLSVLFYLLVDNVPLLAMVRFFHGIGYGLSNTMFITAAVSGLPPTRRGEGNGFFAMSIAGASAVGPFLALTVVGRFNYVALFLVCIACHVVSASFALAAKVPEVTEDTSLNDFAENNRLAPPTIKEEHTLWIWTVLEKKALVVSGIMFFGGICMSGILAFLNTYAIESGISKWVSLFFLVYAMFLFFARPLSGKVYDTKGENIVIITAYISFASTFLLLWGTHSVFLFLLAAPLLAFGYGSLMPCVQTLAVKLSPVSHMALAISTYYIFLDLGSGLGGYLMGYIADLTGIREMYLSSGILLLAMIPVYWLVHGRKTHRLKKILAQK
jgi:MFS family permease